MFTEFNARIVRQDSCGVQFNFIVADEVAELWYDTPPHPQTSLVEGAKLPLSVNPNADIGWKEMAILRDKIVRPGDRVLECGCHHGLTTIFLAAWAGPNGFVEAFDAVLFNAFVARRNLEINGITNAGVYCAAIGGKRQIAGYQSDSNVIVGSNPVAGLRSTIVITLQDAVRGKPDVLKLDVEGSELEILESSATLVAEIPRLAIELHTDILPRDGAERVVRILKDRRLWVLWENGTFERYEGQRISERVHLFAFEA
jgi:FkbM family methyltransferase